MLLHHLAAGAAARRSSGDPLLPPLSRRIRRRSLIHLRADSFPRPLSAAPSPPAKPSVCTADELHYAPVTGAGWRVALWRYAPPAQAPVRNHPLMLLSGVGTNAIGFDLSPGASFARHMSSQGFDTWIVEVRGAGLSLREYDSSAASTSDAEDICNSVLPLDKQNTSQAGPLQSTSAAAIDGDDLGIVALDEPQIVTELTGALMHAATSKEAELRKMMATFLDRISKLLEDARLNENVHEITEKISGLSEMVESATITGPMRDESLRLVKIFQEQLGSWERFVAILNDFQGQMHLAPEYNWDFDHYLEEDIPAAMEYISHHCKAKGRKLLAIGHSMGGILLYAMLSKSGFEGVPTNLAAIVTLASSVDYTTSDSSLKKLLPLAYPAQFMNVPVVPLGTLLAAAYPLASGPPYLLSWLNPQISAQDMMHPELFSKLVFNNFCTVPAKVILQLTTAFEEGGLRNRTSTFSYKHHLRDCQTPVLALAGDQDLICPPEAVYETVKLIPRHMVNYRVFGKLEGPHYAHYDLVGGRLAVDEVYPCVIEFLSRHDQLLT